MTANSKSLIGTLDTESTDQENGIFGFKLPETTSVFGSRITAKNDPLFTTAGNKTGENKIIDADKTNASDRHCTCHHQFINDCSSPSHSASQSASSFQASEYLYTSANKENASQHSKSSLEHVDAQIRALSNNQDDLVKSFLQQHKILLKLKESVIEALKKDEDAIVQLKEQLEELNDFGLSSLSPEPSSTLNHKNYPFTSYTSGVAELANNHSGHGLPFSEDQQPLQFIFNPSPSAAKPRQDSTLTSSSQNGHCCTGFYFAPDNVVKTGKENEEVLFEDRAKLYRYVEQEWKERGIGVVKILYDGGSSRVRLLMRHDQVLKVCANHCITSNMKILPLKNSDKAWTWVAPDFADEDLRTEHFCIRFKTPEIAAVFKTAFEKAISISKDAEATKVTSPKMTTTIVTSPLSQKPFGGKFLPKAGSWTCPTCYVSNTADKLLCIACETKKPGSQASTSTSVTSTVTSLSSENKSPFQTTTVSSPFSFGFPTTTSSRSTIASTVSSTNPPKSVFGGFTFSSSPVIQEAETPELKDREILVVSTKSKDDPQVTKVTTPKTSSFTGFSFKSHTPVTIASSSESASSPFSGFAFTSSPVASTSTQPSTVVDTSPLADFSSSQPSTITVTPANISISSIQSSMQNISPAFVFSKTIEKGISSTNEVKTSSTQLNKPESIFVSVSNEGRRVSTGAPETAPEEFVPTAEFKPVVPLPALVNVKTGEENEEKLFGERAKIFRFNSETKEWKERGTGEIKILFLKESHRYRVLMRREQVLKLCANHYILPEIKLTPLNNSDRAWIWIAQDYSEGEMTQVKLAAKFKNSAIAQQFFRVFEKCQNELLEYSNNNPPNPCAGNKNAFDKLLQPAGNSWNCSKCSKSNMNRSSCVYCQTIHNETTPINAVSSLDKKKSESSKPIKDVPNQKDVSKTAPTGNAIIAPSVKTDKPLSELFKPQAGSWECNTCLVRNNADATKCASCETPKPGTISASQPSFGKFQFGSNPVPGYGFGDSKSSDFVFGMKPTTQSTTFSFGLTDLSNKSNEVTGFKPTISTTDEPAVFGGITQKTDAPFSCLGSTALKTDSPASIFGGTPKSDSSVTVSSIFGGTSKKTDSSLNSSIFGGISNKSESASILDVSIQNTDMPKDIFEEVAAKSEAQDHPDTSQKTVPVSSTTQSVFSFGSASQKSDSTAFEFRFGSPQKYEFNFSGVRPRSPTKTPKSPRSPATPSDAEDEEENESFDADNIYFQPVIPLPPKVDVKTGEENETTLFCKRAKLFRFCSGEWKERGIGEIKILQDEDGKKVRLLMRREQVLKVCLNHYLTQDIVFEKRNDKTLSWAATDFSENEPSDEIFALKFKTSEFADEFKATVDSNLSLISKAVSSADVSKAASTFSFKTDTNSKTETLFTTAPLSSVFGTSGSLFGNATSTETASSPFSFSFKDKPNTGTFFSGQNPSDAKGFAFGKASETKDASEDDEVQVVYEARPSPEEVELAKQLQLPPTFFLYKNKPPCPGCIGCEDFLPSTKPVNEPDKTEKTETDNVNFNTSASQEAEITLFKTGKDVIGFGELATQSGLSGFSTTQKKGFEGAGTPLFANLNNSTEGDREDDTVAQGPDIHFEPVIPLPELVEIKTGEEDETPVFMHRAKLFKYDGTKKEWKERGVGDLKILRHKEKLRFRIILRRDQVHKIACNHCIEPNMVLSPLATSDSALCWNALDYSEAQAEASQFAVRFKNKELLEEFRETFNLCKALLKEAVNESSVQVHNTPIEAQNITHKESPSKHTTEYSDSTESSAESQNDHDHSGSESNDEEQDSDDDSFIFEKRCSFEISESNEEKFKKIGPGTLKIMYDDTVYGYHVYMTIDSGQCLCDHVIAINNCLRMENEKVASWAAVDLSVDPPRRRRFRATFSSVDALNEFNTCFQDGKDAALQSEIVEKTDCIYSSSGKQT